MSAGSTSSSPRRHRLPRALVFRLGGRLLGASPAPGARVMEVTALTRVPTGPSHLLGLANLQGAVVPVIDVRPRLDLPTPPWSWPLPVHLVGRGELQVAVAVEEVLGFEPYAPDRVAPLLAGDAPAGLAAFTRGTAPLRTGRALLIDLPGVLAALRPALLSPSPASAVHHAEEGLPWQIR